MAEPPIIGSGKPHSVSLPAGSTVAAQVHKPKGGTPVPETTPEEVRRVPVPDAIPTEKPRARLRPAKRSLPTPAGAATTKAARPQTDVTDHAAILARISQLEQRNDQVRAQLDRLEAEDGDPA